MKRVQIFRVGRHSPSEGAPITFTEADLRASAKAYDPAKHEAPIVVGHPSTDAPAYGWVKSLAFSAPNLEAEPDQVDAQFAQMVNAGRFKRISAAFYTPDSPSNPVPGVYYLRHVGFLGAQPPAVKGLRTPEFAADEEGVIVFADVGDMVTATLFRRIREFLIEKFGADTADKVIPDYHVATLEDEARQDETGAVNDGDGMQAATAYSEHQRGAPTMKTQKEIDDAAAKVREGQEQLARDRAEFAEREKKLREGEAARRRSGIVEFMDSLVKQGKVLPVERAPMIELLAAQAPDASIEFGEGDKKVKEAAEGWLRKFLGALPKRVEFREAGAGDGSENDDREIDASTLAAAAVAFVETERVAGRVVNTAHAVEHVKKTLVRQ